MRGSWVSIKTDSYKVRERLSASTSSWLLEPACMSTAGGSSARPLQLEFRRFIHF